MVIYHISDDPYNADNYIFMRNYMFKSITGKINLESWYPSKVSTDPIYISTFIYY